MVKAAAEAVRYLEFRTREQRQGFVRVCQQMRDDTPRCHAVPDDEVSLLLFGARLQDTPED